MEELLMQLIEVAKKNRKGFKNLKHTAVICQQYELASKLREIENEAFPETRETKLAKVRASEIKTALSMVELNVDAPTCWLLSEVIRMYDEKQGEFSIEDGVKLRLKKEEIFLTD